MTLYFGVRIKSFLGEFFSPAMLVLKIAVIIIVSIIVVKLGSFIIKKVFKKQKSLKYGIDSRKLDTLCTLLVSIFRYTVYIIAGITILSDLGIVNTGSVLAAAGVGGIVIGFGAQNLIRDIMSGFFIILENQFVVGDTITIENLTGTVEELELRITKIRNPNGDLHIIPNGDIKKITNHSRGDKAVIVDIPVAYASDIDKAFKTAENACDEISKDFGGFLENPKVLGVTELGRESLTLRIIARTPSGEQWEAEREIRKRIKEEFDRAGIGLGIGIKDRIVP